MFKEDKDFLTYEDKEFIEKTVLSLKFPFYFQDSSKENDKKPMLIHNIFLRKEISIKDNLDQINSSVYPYFVKMFNSFTIKNKIKVKSLERMCINLTFNNGHDKCEVHEDHPYKHKQLIIYLNEPEDKNSKTILFTKKGTKEIIPEKYKGVCFDSVPHYFYYPKFGHRIVFVATFI